MSCFWVRNGFHIYAIFLLFIVKLVRQTFQLRFPIKELVGKFIDFSHWTVFGQSAFHSKSLIFQLIEKNIVMGNGFIQPVCTSYPESRHSNYPHTFECHQSSAKSVSYTPKAPYPDCDR